MVTCHNYGRYLLERLESLLARERPADEIVVGDDASDEDTPEVAVPYAGQGMRCEQAEYRDATRSYNHGIAATTGDPIAFVDTDNGATRGVRTGRWVPIVADPPRLPPLDREPRTGLGRVLRPRATVPLPPPSQQPGPRHLRVRGNRLPIRREHFQSPFWSLYTHPDRDLGAALVPGQALPGVILCHVALTPRVRVDLRPTPRYYQAIVLRGDRLGVPWMLLPGGTVVRERVGAVARRVGKGGGRSGRWSRGGIAMALLALVGQAAND